MNLIFLLSSQLCIIYHLWQSCLINILAITIISNSNRLYVRQKILFPITWKIFKFVYILKWKLSHSFSRLVQFSEYSTTNILENIFQLCTTVLMCTSAHSVYPIKFIHYKTSDWFLHYLSFLWFHIRKVDTYMITVSYWISSRATHFIWMGIVWLHCDWQAIHNACSVK